MVVSYEDRLKGWLQAQITELRLTTLWIETKYDSHFPPEVYVQFDILRQRLYRHQAELVQLSAKAAA